MVLSPKLGWAERMKTLFVVKLLACALFLAAGCSVRPIPLDQSIVEQDPAREYATKYDGSYYSVGGISNPRFVADAWRMSQYYRDGVSPNQLLPYPYGDQPPDRLNVDPNPYDSYRSNEAPILRAPAQNATQPTRNAVKSERRARSSRSSNWKRNRFVDRTGAKERQVRRSLKQRRQAENIDDVGESSEEKSRRKTRQRTRRRK